MRTISQYRVRDLPTFQNGLIIDVRSPDEFSGPLGHLPNSKHVPLQDLYQRAAGWPRHTPILAVCDAGRRSMEACQLLAKMGFTKIANLHGGLLAWKATQALI